MAVETREQTGAAPASHTGLFELAGANVWYATLLLLLAVGMEGVLLVLLRRLSIERYPTIIQSPQPLAEVLGITAHGLTWFVLVMAALAVLYVAAYAVALRIKDHHAGVLAFLVAAALILTAIPMFPGGAQDVYHNVADARTLWVYHENPISTPPAAHPGDPIAGQLFTWQDITSSYGPVWYIVSGAPLPFTHDGLVRNLVGQKVLLSAFLLATLWLVYITVRARWPERATAAVVLLGWSPLALWEVPGNAHNDIVMMFFAVAALACVLRGRWLWAFPLLALGVGAKFTMLALAPLLFVWLWRRLPRDQRRTLYASVGVSVALLAVIYLPFLLGGSGLANTSALRDRFISSPASLTIAFLMQYVSLSRAEDVARALAVVAFAAGYGVVLYRCWRGSLSLTLAAFWAVFLLLVLPTWWFWPWYTMWLLPLAALCAGRRAATLGVLFGVTSLMVYPIYYWRDVLLNGMDWYANQFVIVGAVFGPIAIYLLATYGSRLLAVLEPSSVSAED